MNENRHRFQPERTNGGAYFSDCSCGWAGGVYPDRSGAKRAHETHILGGAPTGALKPMVLLRIRSAGERE